jgi:hypothetical protein
MVFSFEIINITIWFTPKKKKEYKNFKVGLKWAFENEFMKMSNYINKKMVINMILNYNNLVTFHNVKNKHLFNHKFPLSGWSEEVRKRSL